VTRSRTPLPILAAALALSAGAARAEPAPTALRDAVFQRPPEPARPAGIAKTSLDHSFARRGADGSVGFLCGLQPKAVTEGAAGAYGVDPQGRFLGVKLHMTFR